MLQPRTQVARMLHEEHVAVLALLQRLSSLLGGHGPDSPPNSEDPALRRLFGPLSAAIETEIKTHFEFEETALFPLLDAFGERELGELYVEEHKIIVPLGDRTAAFARIAGAQGFDAQAWAAFHRDASAFSEHLTRHAEADAAALVPLLDDLLDADEDDRLALAYEAMR